MIGQPEEARQAASKGIVLTFTAPMVPLLTHRLVLEEAYEKTSHRHLLAGRDAGPGASFRLRAALHGAPARNVNRRGPVEPDHSRPPPCRRHGEPPRNSAGLQQAY